MVFWANPLDLSVPDFVWHKTTRDLLIGSDCLDVKTLTENERRIVGRFCRQFLNHFDVESDYCRYFIVKDESSDFLEQGFWVMVTACRTSLDFIIKVQPMTAPLAKIFHLKAKYVNN